MSDNQHIVGKSSLRRYFTMIPNLVDDSDLSPSEFRLLVHYLRVGTCYQSVRTMAETCHMNKETIIGARRSLEAKGWVKVKTNARGMLVVQVKDKWGANMRHYANPRVSKAGCTERGNALYGKRERTVRKEGNKEELIKKNPLRRSPQGLSSKPVPQPGNKVQREGKQAPEITWDDLHSANDGIPPRAEGAGIADPCAGVDEVARQIVELCGSTVEDMPEAMGAARQLVAKVGSVDVAREVIDRWGGNKFNRDFAERSGPYQMLGSLCAEYGRLKTDRKRVYG